MSIHAESTADALQQLRAQRRNTTISSILIASLVVALIALTLGIFLLPRLIVSAPTITVVCPAEPTKTGCPPTDHLPVTMQLKPASPPASMARLLVANIASPLSLPIPEVEATIPALGLGEVENFGQAWGNAFESGSGPGPIPQTFRNRCSKQDRLTRLQQTGGTIECDDAVIRSLDWLKATQNSDGSWTGSNQAAMTGFALLAYLGHCETPLSKDYGESCLRAIIWLIDTGLKHEGKLTTDPTAKHWPYEHAIATYALAEATTFCNGLAIEIPNLKEITQKAGQIIINNQNPKTGGWEYAYDTSSSRGGDLSITAWQVQALKACRHTGMEFKGLIASAKKSGAYIASMQCHDGGFAYAKANETPHSGDYRTMTGGGLLCLQLWNQGSRNAVRKGSEYIQEHTKFDYDTGFSDLYGHYYEAQAMLNEGGEAWEKYNAMIREPLLENQNPDGSWKAPGGGGKIRAVAPQFVTNVHYRTCLNTLTLEVYYRFLPGTATKLAP